MGPDREHPLYYLDAETTLVAIYVWVDDELKALREQGVRLPRPQKHQKATLAELITVVSHILWVNPGGFHDPSCFPKGTPKSPVFRTRSRHRGSDMGRIPTRKTRAWGG